MQLFGIRVFETHKITARSAKRRTADRLRAATAVMLTLTAGVPSGFAQEQQSGGVKGAGSKGPQKEASPLPQAPNPKLTEPFALRPGTREFYKPAGRLLGDWTKMYRPTDIPKANFANSVRLDYLVKVGKFFLSLSFAFALAIENINDIAISRYVLDIADTDILLTRSG